ncbi:MAG: hypothetical protein ABSF67_15200 [Roseiarcus sp.]|jgi:uncharacterized protein YodC (DUF2158 family)
MIFKAGDEVRFKGPLQARMTVNSVSAAGVLCEWREKSAIRAWTWPAEALEPVEMFKSGPPETPDHWFPRI